MDEEKMEEIRKRVLSKERTERLRKLFAEFKEQRQREIAEEKNRKIIAANITRKEFEWLLLYRVLSDDEIFDFSDKGFNPVNVEELFAKDMLGCRLYPNWIVFRNEIKTYESSCEPEDSLYAWMERFDPPMSKYKTDIMLETAEVLEQKYLTLHDFYKKYQSDEYRSEIARLHEIML